MKKKRTPADAIANSTENWANVAYFLRDQKTTPVAVRRVMDLLGWMIEARGFAVPEERNLIQRYFKGW